MASKNNKRDNSVRERTKETEERERERERPRDRERERKRERGLEIERGRTSIKASHNFTCVVPRIHEIQEFEIDRQRQR